MKRLFNSRRGPSLVTGLAILAFGASLYETNKVQSAQPQTISGLAQYTFGTPSGDETEILATINRARSNPAAEGQRLVDTINALYPSGGSGIDTGLLLSQFQSYPARPPLAFNADLNASAQAHNADMIATGVQQHNSPDGTPFNVRIELFGYAMVGLFENVAGEPFLPATFAWTTESSYEVDTGTPGYGHRVNVMEPTSLGENEIGIAQRSLGGWNTTDFGDDNTVPLLVGVVFTDNAKTGFYASGEGVASVIVTAPGASSYYAVTVESGAYTLPLDLVPAYNASAAAPTVQVVFTDALGTVTTKTVTLTHTVGTDGYSTYTDAQGQVRYDNAEADLVEAAASGTTPNPTPTPTPVGGTPKPAEAKPDVSIAPVADSTRFVLTRTGDTSEALVVNYVVKGTAVAGQDYLPLKGMKKFKPGKSAVSINVQMLPGATGTVKLKIVPATDASYNALAPTQAKLRLISAE